MGEVTKGMPRWVGWRAGGLAAALALLAGIGGVAAPAAGQTVDRARPIVERAVDLMGGEDALRSVQRVALDMLTQWQRPNFRDVP